MAARRAASLQNGGDPTLEEEDARRPSRELEILVGERTRIINRMKAALVRLGIRGFKPGLLTAPQKLDALRTPEETPIPPNMLDEMRRDMARLAWVREQINAIEQARLERVERAPATGRHAMVRMLARVGVGVETADVLVQEVLSRNLRDRRAVARYAGQTRAGRNDVSRVCPRRATRGCVAVSSNWRGASCAFRRKAPWRSGTEAEPKMLLGSVRGQ